MAVENHNANPIIIEPATPSDPETPPRLLTPSLGTRSSSNSFDSSRPQSRGSSATSPSESLSPTPRDARSHQLSDISPPTPLTLEPPTPSTALPITPVPSEPAGSSSHSNGAAWLSPLSSRRRWLEHAMAVFTLVASLVGLLFIGVRTYKLAVISTENSTLDSCTGLVQSGFTTLENSTPLCKTAMKNGPLSSPYHLGKRTLHKTLALASRWMRGPAKYTCGFPYIACQSQEANTTYRNMSTPATIIGTTVALGALILMVARRNARSTEVFTSPALSDLQITDHDNSGPKSVTGQGIIERHNPEDHHDLGQLRKRIRASQDQDKLMKDTAPLQSANSSSTTLVGGLNKSQVSLQNHSSGEKHEGLIELQMNGNTKAFLHLETGEFFRLKHWKRQHKDDSVCSSDSDNSLSIEEKDFAQRGHGASALAKGNAFKVKLKEELQLEHGTWRDRHSHGNAAGWRLCCWVGDK